MASYPTRVYDFEGNAPVPSLAPLDDEFDQLVGSSGVFNGGTSATKLLTKTSDGSDPVYEFDQLGAGPIIECKQAGTLKVSILNSGKIDSSVVTGTAPIEVDSTTMCPNLNADQVDGIEGANIAKLDTNVVPWSCTWFVADPSTAATGTEEYPSLLVPSSSTEFKVTTLKIEFRGGSHTSGAFARFKVVRRGAASADVGTIEVNDTNNTAFTLYSNDVADVTLSAGDRLVFTLDARSGTVSERNVSVFAEGTRKLT